MAPSQLMGLLHLLVATQLLKVLIEQSQLQKHQLDLLSNPQS